VRAAGDAVKKKSIEAFRKEAEANFRAEHPVSQ
jgi:hypothetical protein